MRIKNKLFFGLIAGGVTCLLVLIAINSPIHMLWIIGLGLLCTTAYLHPPTALTLLLSLPILGEYGRLELAGQSLLISDIAIPLTIISIAIKLKPTSKDIQTLKNFTPLLIFIFLATLSLVNSLFFLPPSDVIKGSLYLIRFATYAGLFPITTLLLKRYPQFNLSLPLSLISLLISLGGAIQLIFMPNLEILAKTAGYDPHINRLTGSWLDPNLIGGFFTITSLLFINLYLDEKSPRRRWLYSLTSIISLISLFFTYSRSSYLAFIAGALIIGILRARKQLFVLFCIIIIALSFSERAQQRLGELSTSINAIIFQTYDNPDPTARLRIKNWEESLILFKQKPLLGYGYNNLPTIKQSLGFISDEQSHSASGSDSSLLTIILTTGLVGFTPFLLFLIQNTLYSWKNWLQHRKTATKSLALSTFSIILALLIHSSFVNSLLFAPIMIYFYTLLGQFYHSTEQSL